MNPEEDVSTLREFYLNLMYFEEIGIEAWVADPRDMELKGDKLYAYQVDE